MNTAVFGFPGHKIDALAATLAEHLQIPLYQQRSPLTGIWYSSDDITAVINALRAGQTISPALPNLRLEANDPEPGYSGATMPGDSAFLLSVTADEHDMELIEQRLQNAGLGAQRLR